MPLPLSASTGGFLLKVIFEEQKEGFLLFDTGFTNLYTT